MRPTAIFLAMMVVMVTMVLLVPETEAGGKKRWLWKWLRNRGPAKKVKPQVNKVKYQVRKARSVKSKTNRRITRSIDGMAMPPPPPPPPPAVMPAVPDFWQQWRDTCLTADQKAIARSVSLSSSRQASVRTYPHSGIEDLRWICSLLDKERLEDYHRGQKSLIL
ncbi:uncharacterized protein LOC143301509 [Babylonia areolata]|uniref:uncharacterized protein LOC143301509 n=1 Tax=Babylonia areolata TaxID=304850 RepID=UPI003FD0C2DF